MKIPCNIVQDLLPNYIDELCSKETQKQVSEHMEKCLICAEKYREMKGELPKELWMQEEVFATEEIQPLKKIRKRHIWHMASLTVLMVMLVFGAGVSVVRGSNEGYDRGYHTGYGAGNDEGYDTGYMEGTDVGYHTGYSDGYVDGTAENEDLLTMKVETCSVGELFANLELLMQKKWGVDEKLWIMLEEEAPVCSIQNMYFSLMDGNAKYLVESYCSYSDNVLTIEVKRIRHEQQEEEKELFRFSALTDCMEAAGFSWDAEWSRDIIFLFQQTETIKNAPVVSVTNGYDVEKWIYRNKTAEKCEEDIQLEGAYDVLTVMLVEPEQGEDGKTSVAMPEFVQFYMERK